MNIYEKLAVARAKFKASGVKQSGNNTYAGYTYFDLADILPKTTEIENELKMLSVVRYDAEQATLTIYNVEKPEEFIEFTSPMSTAELKGCHPVQNLGAVETYVRRYLYLAAYEIVETEALDKTQGDPEKAPEPRVSKNASTHTPQRAQSEMTLEKAEAVCFKSGRNANKPFKNLDDNTLNWVAQNSNGIYVEAAKMVLASRNKEHNEQAPVQETIEGLTPYDGDDDLPF